MNPCHKEQHRKAGKILVYFTAKELICDKREVFRLAHSLVGSTEEEDWKRYQSNKPISDITYDFCLDVLARRIVPITINRKKAKKR